MSSVVLSGDSSGTVTLTVPSAAGTNTATLPAATGTVMVSGNMPAFSAYQSSQQSLSSGVLTKIQFQTKEFDTANCFNNSTYVFTPTVAGYYQVNSQLSAVGSSSISRLNVQIFKNGSLFKIGNDIAGSTPYRVVVSSLIYMNGTTDYLEIYCYSLGTSVGMNNTAYDNYFQANLVRTA